jgi:hypothetical protein
MAAMERVLRSSSLAALLFLTLVLVAASASTSCRGGHDDDGDGDDVAAVAAAAAEDEKQEQCHPRADEPFMLAAFHNRDAGEEIRVLSDQRSGLLSGVTGYANRSGHWFYSPVRARREEGGGSGTRRRFVLLSQPQPHSGAKGLWNKLSVLLDTKAADDDDDNDEQEAGYILIGMETSGGDKIRLVVIADQRYFSITGKAQGFSSWPRWFCSDRHSLLPLDGGNGSSSSFSYGSSSYA